MSVESHRIVIGACGWLHKSWINDFYPEDLPIEWRLGFYSNEFQVVYVAATDWIDAPDFTDWADEVADTFRFILELPDFNLNNNDELYQLSLKKAQLLGEYCLGLVIKLNQDDCMDLKQLEIKLKAASSIAPVCIDSRKHTLSNECQTLLINNNISEVWVTGHSEKIVSPEKTLHRGNLAICHVSGEQLDTIELRKIIEGCLAASNEQRVSVLCIDGLPPSLELMSNANVILNLL